MVRYEVKAVVNNKWLKLYRQYCARTHRHHVYSTKPL